MEKANNVSDKGSSLTEKIKDLLPIEIQDFVTGDDILNLTKSSNLSEELTLLISNLDVDVNVNIQELCQEIEKIIAKSKQPNNVAKPMNKSVQIIDLLRKTLGSYANFITTEYIEKAAHKLLRCNILSLRDEINLFIKNSNEEIKRLTYNDPSITLRANVDELFTSIKKIREQKEEIKDTIFSDNALKDIQKYLLVESKSHKTNDLVNFSGGNVKNSEVTDNRYSRFSLQQINLMLSNGVSPSCLHDINDFDTFIRFNCLTDDINKRSISDLHPSFIEFLYIESNSNGEHLSKASTVDQLTKDFMQKLISKYIQDKNLSSVEKIDGNPIIKFLFFKGDGTLRDKKEINKLLGSDEEIFEMLMKAKVSWMLILDIINNYHIDLQLSENWLSKLEEKHEFDEYIFLAYTVKQKKLMTFRLEDLLGNKNQKVNDLLAGKEVKEDECTLKFTDKQIELAKAIKIIAGDLQTIKEYFQQNKDNKENNTKEDKLKKLFNHQFLYNNLLDQIFFTSLVTFFKEEIFSDLSDQIDDAVNTEDWRKVFEHKAISHFLKNLKSDFIISILLLRFLESSFFKNTDVNSFAEFLIVLFDSVKEAEHQNENQNQENNIEKKMENNENNNVATNTSKSDQLISEDRATIYASLHERNKNHNNLSENKIEQNIIDNKELKITNEEQNNQKDEKDKIAIKRVFIKTFVAKAKDINRHLTRGGGTLLSYIFDNLNNINQSFKSRVKKYEFNEDDRNYFIACCNEFKVELKNSGNDKNKNQNVISDSKNKNQNSMDEIVSNFLSGKFDTKEDKSKSKNEIVKVNPIKPKEEVHDKKKTSNMFDYTKITNRNLSGFNYKEQSVPSENNTQIKKGGNIISENDYLDDETFNEFMQNHNDDNPKARNYEDIKDEDRKKTDLMKSECMATLYEIDVNIVTHIANLDQCTLNVTDNGFYDSLNNIFKNISNNDDKYKNLIKKCYINLFFFGKEFKALASVYYRSDKALKFFESKFENRFESNEDDKERTILGDKYIEYFRTTWDKRKSYLDEQIKLIGRKSTADLDDEFELYSQLQKNYDLNKEISKSNVEGKLDKYNFPGYDFHTGKNDFYADFIQHIGKKVEDFYCSSFENFFFGYLCVMKNISQKYNITNKYLPVIYKNFCCGTEIMKNLKKLIGNFC